MHVMITRVALAAISIFLPGASALAIDCGSPPPVADVSLRGAIGAEAQFITKKLDSARGRAAASYTRNEVYSRYPNADKAAADRYFQYEICEVIAADPKLTTMQRLAILRDARAQFNGNGRSKQETRAAANGNASPPIQSKTSFQAPPSQQTINENRGSVAGNQFNAQNMSFNATPDRRKYLPGLQDIYSRGSAIYRQLQVDQLTNEAVDRELSAANKWLTESHFWLEENMSPAAAASLLNVKIGGLTYGVGSSLDGPHQNTFSILMIQFPEYLDNVKYLMYSNTFDPQ